MIPAMAWSFIVLSYLHRQTKQPQKTLRLYVLLFSCQVHSRDKDGHVSPEPKPEHKDILKCAARLLHNPTAGLRKLSPLS